MKRDHDAFTESRMKCDAIAPELAMIKLAGLVIALGAAFLLAWDYL